MLRAEKLSMIKRDLKYLTDDEVDKLYRMVVGTDDDVILIDISEEYDEREGQDPY